MGERDGQGDQYHMRIWSGVLQLKLLSPLPPPPPPPPLPTPQEFTSAALDSGSVPQGLPKA